MVTTYATPQTLPVFPMEDRPRVYGNIFLYVNTCLSHIQKHSLLTQG